MADINETDSSTQRKLIKQVLDRGETITPLDALKFCKSMKLATRVSELIKSGYPIEKGWMDTPSGKRVRTYRKGNTPILNSLMGRPAAQTSTEHDKVMIKVDRDALRALVRLHKYGEPIPNEIIGERFSTLIDRLDTILK